MSTIYRDYLSAFDAAFVVLPDGGLKCDTEESCTTVSTFWRDNYLMIRTFTECENISTSALVWPATVDMEWSMRAQIAMHAIYSMSFCAYCIITQKMN